MHSSARKTDRPFACGSPGQPRVLCLPSVFRFISWTCDLPLYQYSCTSKRGVSVDHASAVAAPKSDPVFLHVKPGMTVIVADTEGAWRMADVIWADGGARNPKVPTLFQVADVDTGVINWINRPGDSHRPQGLS